MIRKFLLILIGTLFLIIGIIGIFVPILPTTPFLLLTSICYIKSSEKMHTWLIDNRYFGQYLNNYIKGFGMPIGIKIITVLLLWISILYSILFATENIYIIILLFTIAIIVSFHIIFIKKSKKKA